jgi:hypothetical protein
MQQRHFEQDGDVMPFAAPNEGIDRSVAEIWKHAFLKVSN